MKVRGSWLEMSYVEAQEVQAIIVGALPTFDPFGPSKVSKLRELMGEATWSDVRLAPRFPNPDLLGLAVKVVADG